MMGDTVLFEDEVNPVMSVALDQGLERDGVAQSLFLRPTEGLFHAHRRPGQRGEAGDGAFAKFTTRLKKSAPPIRTQRTPLPKNR